LSFGLYYLPKVNTHQLAAYTDELFVKVGEIEKKVTENITISSEHFKNLLAKSEAQEAQIDKLMKIVEIQAKQLERVNEILFEKKTEEIISRPRALTIEDLKQDQIQENISVPKNEAKIMLTPDEDDCFLSNPPKYCRNYTEIVDTKRDIIRGSFTIDLDDILGPVAKSLGLTEEEAKKQLEKEIANSQRAVSSRNYCGNE